MIYVAYDGNGRITGFYSPEIHEDNIPSEAIEITGEQWQECLKNQYHWVVDINKKELVFNSEAFLPEMIPQPPTPQEEIALLKQGIAELTILMAMLGGGMDV